MTWPICSTTLQKVTHLCLNSVEGNAAGGVVTAERLNHVVGEKALHVVQHPRGAQVQLLLLLRWQ